MTPRSWRSAIRSASSSGRLSDRGSPLRTGGDHKTTLAGNTHGMVGLMQPTQTLQVNGDSVFYLVSGEGEMDSTPIRTGALARTPAFNFRATDDSYVFVATSNRTAYALD